MARTVFVKDVRPKRCTVLLDQKKNESLVDSEERVRDFPKWSDLEVQIDLENDVITSISMRACACAEN